MSGLKRDREILRELFTLRMGEEIRLYNRDGEVVYLRRIPTPAWDLQPDARGGARAPEPARCT